MTNEEEQINRLEGIEKCEICSEVFHSDDLVSPQSGPNISRPMMQHDFLVHEWKLNVDPVVAQLMVTDQETVAQSQLFLATV